MEGYTTVSYTHLDVYKRQDQEMGMKALHPGWAEQDPNQWWSNIKLLAQKIISKSGIDGKEIKAIGISYQMHGLVLVDKDEMCIRDSP